MAIRIGSSPNPERIYIAGAEVDQVFVGAVNYWQKQEVPAITALSVTPNQYIVSNQAPPKVTLDWTVTGEDSVAVKMIVPYFADSANGVVTTLTPDAVNDGSVSLTAAQNAVPYNDHWGYRRQGIATGFAKRGNIADEATSLVQVLGGHRSSSPAHDNFHISWTGMPTSGSVYGRWVPNTGNSVDFTLNITNVAAAWRQWANIPVHDPYYSARANNASFAGAWNASSGLPAGKFYLYSDSARTQQINLRTIPISDGSSVEVQLPVNAAWTYVRSWNFSVTATNNRGKTSRRTEVTRVRTPVISQFRVRPGSFRRGNFNNNLRYVYLEWTISGYPHPDLSLAYAPSNTFAHPLRLTAADPDRRTQYDAQDTGTGDDRVTILTGSGAATYRLTATNAGGTVTADAQYEWAV